MNFGYRYLVSVSVWILGIGIGIGMDLQQGIGIGIGIGIRVSVEHYKCYIGMISIIYHHICTKFAYISPIYHQYIIKIKAVFHTFEFGKNLKIRTPPLLLKVVHNWNRGLFDFRFCPPPPLWAFSTFYDICFLYCSPKQKWSLTLKTQVLLLNMFRYIQEYWRQIPALPQAYLKHTF